MKRSMERRSADRKQNRKWKGIEAAQARAGAASACSQQCETCRPTASNIFNYSRYEIIVSPRHAVAMWGEDDTVPRVVPVRCSIFTQERVSRAISLLSLVLPSRIANYNGTDTTDRHDIE